MTTPAETFPAGIPTAIHRCDYCGRERTVAHVRIASEQDTWLLCVACIRANHTDDEVRAALEARYAREREAACCAKEPAPPPVPATPVSPERLRALQAACAQAIAATDAAVTAAHQAYYETEDKKIQARFELELAEIDEKEAGRAYMAAVQEGE